MDESWRNVRRTKNQNEEDEAEQFDDDFYFEVAGKQMVIHQKNVGNINSETDLGAVGRIVWDSVRTS